MWRPPIDCAHARRESPPFRAFIQISFSSRHPPSRQSLPPNSPPIPPPPTARVRPTINKPPIPPLFSVATSFSLFLSLALNTLTAMVVALGPGRFYGSSLPRPRFYGESKLNGGDRVDPPEPVMEPLLAWAREAHWSMGGLSFQRRRLQGRIEGSIARLRAHQERREKEASFSLARPSRDPVVSEEQEEDSSEEEREEEMVSNKRKRVRKLGEEFDRIAASEGIYTRIRSRRSTAESSLKVKEEAVPRRTSPRKKNKRSMA